VKILYFGGQKSGKSLLAEQKALQLSEKPIYLATYDSSFVDDQMQKRIKSHQIRRDGKFSTLEETLYLSRVIKEGKVYLVDCISMWILNTIEWRLERVLAEIERLAQIDAKIIFVLNDVSSGVIPVDKISREFVDRSGVVGQKLVGICTEVYEVKFGLEIRLK